MKSHARVVVIGGGVVGCSVLYHLAKRGWSDVALIERSDLTAGSTWHAAGGMHTLNGDANVAALQAYTIGIYEEIERASGVSCGVHKTGCLYLATTEKEEEFFLSERSKARHLGIALDFVSLSEAKRLNPLIDTDDYRAAMFDPNDGHVDPSGVTNAYAQAARNLGAEIYRHTPVTQIRRQKNGEWELNTDAGVIQAEYVVNAAGLWAREVGRMFGVNLPIVPMEHQYIVTNEIPELVNLGREIPAAVDFDGAAYLRQERHGLVLGTYEQNCRHWAVKGTPADFGIELLPPDLERIAEPLALVMERMPPIGRAGVKRIVNGGMVFAPDGNPIIGPLPGHPTAFVAAGVMAGFSQGGGVGLAVANWIVDGEPGLDVFAMDVARFGDFATREYVLAKTRENYQRRFILPCPNEDLSAARPCKTSPVYDRLSNDGASFGVAAGWEVPMWFAESAAEAFEPPSRRRTRAHSAVEAECLAARNAVVLWETSSYCKILVAGEGSRAWLDRVLANVVPAAGRLAISPMLTPTGRILGDVIVAALANDRFLLTGSPSAETLYLRWLQSQLDVADVVISTLTDFLMGLSISGPRSRELLGAVTSEEVSNDAFGFRCVKGIEVGIAPVIALRTSFTGELGYELYMHPGYQRSVYECLVDKGSSLGLRHLGARALNVLRLEKGYPGWGRELTQDHFPWESGIQAFVAGHKSAFIGRDALLDRRRGGTKVILRLLRIDSRDPDPTGGEVVLQGARAVGRLTSAAYSHRFGFTIGLAYLPSAIEVGTTGLSVELLGDHLPAQVLAEAPEDPRGHRLRM
jgi:dimethylglycine dehydrogenase